MICFIWYCSQNEYKISGGDNLKKRYSRGKCPECDGPMVITETLTFDGTNVHCQCKNCNYSATYLRWPVMVKMLKKIEACNALYMLIIKIK